MWSLAGLRKRAVAVAPRRRRRPRRRNRRRMAPTKFGFGAALPRKEDDALLRGAGRYVADHAPEETLYAVLLRSPHAHARFRITDGGKAGAMPGVALVLSAKDTASLGALPCQGEIPGTDIVVPPYPVLARDEVRHVGDAIAFVVADTPDKARDAAEAISVEWEPVAPMIGAAPDELRRRNFITAMPYTTPTGKTYDSGEPGRHLRRAQEGADWNGFERRLAQSRE